jgi:hypothetical protein
MFMGYHTLLVVVLLGLGQIATTISADSASSAKGFVVVDTNGKEIGPVFSVSETFQWPVILLTVSGFKFLVRVVSNGGLDGFSAGRNAEGGEDTLLFESVNCTRTPYMYPSGNNIMLVVVVSGPGSTVYRPDNAEVTIMTNSLLLGNRRPGGDCVQASQGPDSVARAIPVIDLNTRFTPPFQVR